MADVTDLTLSPTDMDTALAGLRDAWRRRHPGILDDQIPEAMQMTVVAKTPSPAINRRITLADQPHNGLLVALWLEPEAAAELALPGGEDAENLHITLAYVPDADDWDELTRARVIAAVDRSVRWLPVVDGKVGGYGRFIASETSDAMDVFYASVDIPRLHDLRESVTMELCEAGVRPSDAHGYTPHITLAYIDPDADNPVDRVPDLDLSFPAATVMLGEQRIDIPLYPEVGLFAEPRSLHPANGVGKNGQVFHDFRTRREFTGASEWVQFLPVPGTYQHVLYGELAFTPERYARIVANFTNGTYDQKLPINAEHDMSASGAVGYIVDMRIGDDGAIEVKPEWNERGQALLDGDRFRYVSAEYFESWQDPVSGEWHDDVAFGMAICTNPYFKESVLRPLAASEAASRRYHPADGREGDMGMTNPEKNTKPTEQSRIQQNEQKPEVNPADTKDTVTLSEAEVGELRAFKDKYEASEQGREAAEGQVTKLAERVAAMEKDARHKRFTDLVAGRGGSSDGQVWFGDPEKHVALLETLAAQFGEDSDEVKGYIEQQQGIASQLKDSALFREVGSSRSSEGDDTQTKVTTLADKLREADPKLTREQAEAKVYAEHPEMYQDAMKEGN